ncbi:MAG: hypothetical protein ACFFGZ_02195 [Candidatus Thorarchaeota archaeon]
MQDSLQVDLGSLQSFLDKNQGNVFEVTVLGGDAPLPDSISFTTHNLELMTKTADGLSSEGFLILKGDDGTVQIRIHARNVIIRENLSYWPQGILIGNDDDGLIVLLRNNGKKPL